MDLFNHSSDGCATIVHELSFNIPTMVEYKDRLAQAMSAANVDVTQLAKLVGVSYQAAKKVVDGMSRAFSAENNSFAAQALGVSSDWLATGKGDMKRYEMTLGGGPAPAPESGKPTVVVPLLANAASMGPGNDIMEHDVMTGDLHLNQEWVEQSVRPSALSALRFIHGYGDSMKGTFNDGDILLVDTGVRIIDIDGVYVLRAHDRLFVKRVRQRWDGKYEISSDNPGIKTSDVLDGREELDVRGRVLWAWNGQKL